MNKLTETDFKQAEYLFSNMSYEQQCDIFSSFFSTGNMITRDLNDPWNVQLVFGDRLYSARKKI